MAANSPPRPPSLRKGGLPIALLLTCFASCADLEDIELDRCGNRVLDPGEDCDGHDSGATPCAPPGAVNACRYTCTFSSADAAAACPEGYRCGLGDVCAKPSNTFAPLDAALVEQGGDAFTVADFDGDRLNDVAIVSGTEAEMSLTFMSGLAPILSTSVPVEPTSSLAVGRIDSDERPDIALGAEAAIVSLGSPSGRRELVPAAFAQYSFNNNLARVAPAPAGASVYPADPNQDQLESDADSEAVLLNFPDGMGSGVAQFYVRNPYDGSTPTVASALPLLEGLKGIVRGRVYEPDGCDDFALGFDAGNAAPQIEIVQLCDAVGAPKHGDPPCADCITSVTLGPGDDLLGLWALDHVEADGTTFDPETELVAVVTAGGVLSVVVVEQDTLAVEPQPVIDREVATPDAIALADQPDPQPDDRPLWVGYLNDDDELDMIGTRGIYASGDGGAYMAAVPSTGLWDEVAVADFNGDGRLDVAAARRTSSDGPVEDVDQLLASPTSYFNPAVLPTTGKANAFGVGDFDGDGLADLVLRDRDVLRSAASSAITPDLPACTELDDLVVFYGSPVGLGERATLARVAGIEQIATGRLPRLDKRDGISDFGMVSHCMGTDPSGNPRPDLNRVTVFYGATNRQVAAPYLLNDARDRDPTMVGSAVDLVPFRPQALAAYEWADARVVAATSTLLEQYAPPGLNPVEPRALFVLETRESTLFRDGHYIPLFPAAQKTFVTLANLDGDPEPEVVASDGNQLKFVDSFACFPDAYEPVSDAGPGCDFNGTGEISTPDLDAKLSSLVSTAVEIVAGLTRRDLDRDGLDDVVVLGSTAAGVPAAVIIWGGQPFNQLASTVVTFDQLTGSIAHAAFLPFYAETGAPAIGATPEERLLLAVPNGGAFDLVSVQLSGRSPANQETIASVADVHDLTAADVDGDGFEDVAILTSQGVRVLRRQPVLAGDAIPQAEGDEP
jgi:hypothetical protein